MLKLDVIRGRRGRLLGCLLAFATLSHAAVQAADSASRDFLLDTWDTEDGLPQGSAVGITQTPDGFLWVGTFGGLARFDGVRFTVFDSNNTPAIRHNSVVRLLTDRRGTLWGAAPGTILSFAKGHWRAHGQVDGWPDVLATALVEDREDNLVAATETELLKLVNGRFVKFPLPSLPTAWLRSSVTFDVDGHLWIARGNYLGRFDKGHWRAVKLPTESTNVVVNGLAPARDGGLWVSTVDGVWKLRRDSWMLARALEFDTKMPGPIALLEDSRGNLWAGDFVKGLMIFTANGDGLRCGRQDGLESDNIRTVFEDREGNVWAGTDGAGLTRFRPRAIVTHDSREGPNLIVNSVYEDVPGQMLVGGTGLRRFAQSGFSDPIESSDDKLFPASRVQTVWKDRMGAVWAGIQDGALFHIVGTSVTRVASSGLGEGPVRVLYEDSAGALWIGSGDTVIQHHAGAFTCYDTNAGVTVGRVYAIAEDSAGQLWVGGHGGLCRKKGARFEQIHPPWATGMMPVLSLFRDSAGAVWINFRKHGVSRWRNGKFELFGVEPGLSDTEIGAFVEDNDRNLWLGTVGQGIVRITRESIEAVATGKRRRLDCLRFGKSEGMRSAECRASYQPSACRSSDGNLWFATVKGLVEIDPARVAPNLAPPPVWIQSVTYGVKGKLCSTNFYGAAIGELRLPAGTQRVQVHYTAPSFAAPQRVRFQHRLAGVDQNWIDNGAAREVTYSDLRPGRYTFQVRAANNDGVWNETSASLSFVAPPFFWQTIWFRFLALASLTGGVGITAWRLSSNKLRRRITQIEQERALEEERARLASVLEATSDLVGFADPQGRALFINAAGRRMLGFGARENVTDRHIRDFHPGWVNESVINEGLRVALREGIWSGETAIVHRDGHEIPVSQVIVAHKGPHGAVSFVSTIARDITERKRVEEELRQSQERLRMIIRTEPECVKIVSRDAVLLDMNPAGLAMLEANSLEEAQTCALIEFIAPEDRLAFRTLHRQVFQGQPGKLEFDVIGLKGARRRLETHAVPLRDGAGAVTALLGVTRDVTERKRAEDALRRNEELFRAVVQDQTEMIVRWKPDGTRTFVNQAYCRFFGKSYDELVGSSVFSSVAAEEDDRIRQKIRLLIPSAPVATGVHRILSPTGKVCWQEWSDRGIFDDNLCLVELQSVGRDITLQYQAQTERQEGLVREQRTREEFMRQLIALQEAERRRIAGELHDSLGQNLLLIKNRAQLGRKLPSIDPELLQRFDDISDLTSQSISEVRRISHDLRPYQLDQLGLTRALEVMMDAAAESSGITLDRRLDLVDDDIRADAATHFYRVVQETLNNILKHSQARHVRVELERDVRCVRLLIEDDGRGFDVNAHGEPSGGRSGFGIKNITERVRILDGGLKLSSEVGKGTRLEVTLPIPELD